MPSAADLKPDEHFRALFIGRSGDGKTVAGGSFPKPMKIYDLDDRINGLIGATGKKGWLSAADLAGIEYTQFPIRSNPDHDGSFFDRLKTEVNNDYKKFVIARLKGEAPPYETVQLDSVTAECIGLLSEGLKLTHSIDSNGKTKGKYLGSVAMAGPEEYGFEATAFKETIETLRSMVGLKHLIVTTHIVDVFGKKDENNSYADSVKIGTKLAIRDKLGEQLKMYFDNIFEFSKRVNGNDVKHYVRFRGELARTTFNQLPDGEVDITGKNFYEYLRSMKCFG